DACLPPETGTTVASPHATPPPDRNSRSDGREEQTGRTLLGARAPERYECALEAVEPNRGDIAGANDRRFAGDLARDGRVLDAETLLVAYQEFEHPVVSCGSGVNACHDAVAMVVAGLTMPDLYPGSYSEWSRRDLPVEPAT